MWGDSCKERPMPCPPYSRIMARPCSSAWLWMAWEISGEASTGHGLGNAEFKAGQSAVDKMLSLCAYCTDTNGKSAVAIVAVE